MFEGLFKEKEILEKVKEVPPKRPMFEGLFPEKVEVKPPEVLPLLEVPEVPPVKPPVPLWKKATAAFTAGVGDVLSIGGTTLELIGAKRLGKKSKALGETLRERYIPPEKPEEFSWKSPLNPKWWATTVSRAVPFTLSLIPAAIVGAYGGVKAAALIGLGTFGKVVLGSLGGAALSRPIESALEAGGTYEEAIARGKTKEEAEKAANKVFWDNMKLVGMDAAQFIAAFAPIKGIGPVFKGALARRMLSVGKVGARIGVVGAVEAGEEGYQDMITRRAIGEKVVLDPRMSEAMAIGAIFGAGLGTAGSVYTGLIRKIEREMPPETKKDFEEIKAEEIKKGIPEQQAEIRALDEIAETPEGRASIERAIEDLKTKAKEVEPVEAPPEVKPPKVEVPPVKPIQIKREEVELKKTAQRMLDLIPDMPETIRMEALSPQEISILTKFGIPRDIESLSKSVYEMAMRKMAVAEVIEVMPKPPRPKVPKPLPEWADVIDEIVAGRILMRAPKEIKTDWIETIGRAAYMRIFRVDPIFPTPDEVATDLGITEAELLEEISNRLRGVVKRTVLKPVEVPELVLEKRLPVKPKIKPKALPKEPAQRELFVSEAQRKALRVKAPWIAKTHAHGIYWGDLTPAQQAAVKQWVVEKKKGLPPDILEQTAELRLPGIPRRIRPTIVEEKVPKDKVQSPLRDFQTFLNLKIKPEVAFETLVKIVKDLEPNIKIKIAPIGARDGWFGVRADGSLIRGIALKDIDDYISLLHETGHVVDLVIIGRWKIGMLPKYPTTLSERIGMVPTVPKFEKELIAELKRVSDFVRPFDRKLAKRGYLAYRNRRVELFTDWFVLYMTDKEMAMSLAPNFTAGIEIKHPKIVEIRKKFTIPVEAVEPYDLPVEKVRNIFNGIFRVFQRVEPSPQIQIAKRHLKLFEKLKARMRNFVGLPFWYGLDHPNPAVKEIWRAVQDEGVYGYHGKFARARKDLDWSSIRKMPEVSQAKIAKMLWTGNDKGVEQYFDDETLRVGYAMNPEEIAAYQRIVKALKTFTEYEIEARKIYLGFYDLPAERQAEFEPVLRKMVERLGGYVPIDRPGEWFVYAEIVDPVTGKREPYLAAEWNQTEGIKHAELLKEMGYEKIGVYQPRDLPPAFHANFKRFSISDLMNVTEAAGVDDTSPDIQKIRDYIAKTGLDKHILRRKWVPGYKRTFEALMQTVENFSERSIRRLSRALAYDKAMKALKRIDRAKEPEAYTYMSDFIRGYFFTSPTEFYAIRQGLYIYFLTASPTYLFQQTVQNNFTLYPEIANYVAGPAVEKVYILGIKDAASYLGHRILKLPTKLDSLTTQLLDRAVNERVISGMFTEMLLGIQTRKGNIFQNILGAFGIASEFWNRTHAMNSAIRIARDYLKMTEPEAIYSFAKEMVEKTAYPYGPSNIPAFIAQTGSLKGAVKVAMVFKMTHLNYLHQLARIILRGRFGAKWRALGVRAFWTGITRILPFGALTLWLIKKLFDYDLETELKKKLGKMRADLAEVILKGAPNWARFDVSDILDIGTIAHPDYEIAGQIFGPMYGVLDRFEDSYRWIQEGRLDEGLARLSPRTISNILTALQWKEEGKEFRENVFMKFSDFEIFQKMISFTPPRVKRMYEIRIVERGFKRKHDILSRRIQEEFKEKFKTKEGFALAKKSALQNDFKAMKELLGKERIEQIKKLNQEVDETIFILYQTADIPVLEKVLDSIEKGYKIEPTQVNEWIKDIAEDRWTLEQLP